MGIVDIRGQCYLSQICMQCNLVIKVYVVTTVTVWGTGDEEDVVIEVILYLCRCPCGLYEA